MPEGASSGDLHSIITRMTAALSHRGPDAQGVWTEAGIALGHRRLSIVDLSSAGDQPMRSACGRYLIAYNGEIYNHLELRHQLRAVGYGHEWQGHSDTETLLAMIAYLGLDETLSRVEGMFAFALWDSRDRRLFLARDRLGEKPLYWGWADQFFVFGSELKALYQHPGTSREVCQRALAQYLRFAFVPAPLSIHKGIFKLEPGCVLQIDMYPPSQALLYPIRPGECYGSLSVRRYWTLMKELELGAIHRFEDDLVAVTSIERVISQSINNQRVADVPLGAFLSGGIDSSVIVALLQAQSSTSVETYTVGFEDDDFNEAQYAQRVAKHLQTNHTSFRVTQDDARSAVPLLAEIYDEPFADPSQIPTYLICRAARADVTVVLTGDGGDELFGGYNRHLLGPTIWKTVAWMPKTLRSGLGGAISAFPEGMWQSLISRKNSNKRAFGSKMHRLASRLNGIGTIDDLYFALISHWPAHELGEVAAGGSLNPLDDPIPVALSNDVAAHLMARDTSFFMPDDILCKVDRAGMAVGLETRIPFLNHDVLAAAARLPHHMRIRNGKGKWVLRQILRKHLPEDLIDRPKTGFAVPLGDWLRGPLREWAENLLSEDALRSDGLIDPIPVRRAWAQHLSRKNDWSERLWIILMLMAWRKSINNS